VTRAVTGGGRQMGTAPQEPLSERDFAVLAVAARTFTGPGPRERAIRERLGMSPTAYFQLLNALLDDPRALAHDPVTVNRLRKERDFRRGQR
jgi:phage major head subunit gpT-like protein